MHDRINIRSARFFLACTAAPCRYCREPTALFALGVPAGHQVLNEDEELPSGTWQPAANSAFIFDVDYLPPGVRSRLAQFTRSFRMRDAADGNTGWVNHCERCGQVLEDQELHCEPGGAFVPTSAVSAEAIRRVRMDEAFEAVAAGYSYEPEFFDAMREGDTDGYLFPQHELARPLDGT